MQEKIMKIVQDIIQNLFQIERVDLRLEYPKDEKFGDYTTNIALVLAKKVGKSPMEIAGQIILALEAQPPKGRLSLHALGIEKIEIAAPGHINFYLSEKYLQTQVEKILQEKENFGNGKKKKEKINNEFISANPTGPLHLGNGRGGFFGDSISRILVKAGYDVTNEYYVNDRGEQIYNKLAHSVMKDEEAVYVGDYIDSLYDEFGERAKKEIDKLINSGAPLFGDGGINNKISDVGQKAANHILEKIIKKTVEEKMKIHFDEWFHEDWICDLISSYSIETRYQGFIRKAIDFFKGKKLIKKEEGALWLKTTKFDDDKDRVLVKSNSDKTYFASDCGYLLSKKERGFDKIIEIWGADHHGYINRFLAAARALGFQNEQVKFVIVQLVKLVKDGKEVRMSKRAGNVVYIDDLIEKVGHDVTRFFFLMYSPDTHMNFDLGLAEEKSQKNPVFYVQYAHARICSILGKIQDTRYLPTGQAGKIQTGDIDLSLLKHEKELSLIRELNKFPELVEELAQTYEVHKLPYYAIKLADKFHSFYNACKVIDEDNPNLTRVRLSLVMAVKIVLVETLSLIGVSSPEKM